ncbi:MAG: lambda exonuclease family protein [Alphaproteobacteria bacterium]|jgi:hypothetical protein
MRVHDVEQGTEAWLNLRLGMPTASRFKDVYTSTGKAATALNDYAFELAGEIISGQRAEIPVNDWMRRGTELEPVAVRAYEFVMDVETEVIGFVTNDEETIGCSPDRMHLEVKCPAAKNHLKYLSADKCPPQYYPQVQGCIWLCETDRWDFMSYHPGIKPLIVTVYRDDNYINGLHEHLKILLEKIEKLKQTAGE